MWASNRVALMAAVLVMVGCGYRVAGRGTRLPADLKTLAVPVFANETPRFRIEQRLASALTREFIDRTSYGITTNPDQADAVLKGTVLRAASRAVAYDLRTGRATTIQLEVVAHVELVHRKTGKRLYSNSHYIFREHYQIDPNIVALFEEDEAALARISRDMAQTLVSEILENF